MNKKNLVIAMFGVVILLSLVIVVLFYGKAKTSQNVDNSGAVTSATNNSATADNTAGTTNTNPTVKSPAPITPASNLSAAPGSPEAPKQETVAVDKIPAKSIKIQVSDKGFEPKEFTVKSGQSVTLALTSTDNIHVFLFPNASLMALTTMVLGGETKTITFNAPAAGTYAFRDDIPANRANTGSMIVK